MNKTYPLLTVVVLLTLGAAGVAYQSRPAAAQEKPKENAPAAVAKWEYRFLVYGGTNLKGAEDQVNKLGDEGFELAFVTGGGGTVYYTLKRAKK